MALIKMKPTSPGTRFVVKIDRSHLHKGGPLESLTTKRVPGEVGFILMSAMAVGPYFEAPPVKSIDCPVSKRTYAFL